MRIKNVNQGIMEKFVDDRWLQIGQDTILDDLLNKGYHILKIYARKYKDDVIEESCDDDEEEYNKMTNWLIPISPSPRCLHAAR